MERERKRASGKREWAGGKEENGTSTKRDKNRLINIWEIVTIKYTQMLLIDPKNNRSEEKNQRDKVII